MYKIERIPVLKDNNYKTLLSITPTPRLESLKKITKKYTNQQKLSSFITDQACCLTVFMNPNEPTDYLDAKNVEYLIDYLATNNITINYQLTEIMMKSNQKLLFYVQ